MTELELSAIFCVLMLGGETEVRHDYIASGRNHYIKVDCETADRVVELGFDGKRSSHDSVHQALFAAHISGKAPMVVIIDTNGVEESVEFQIETAAAMADVQYKTIDKDFLIRYQMTSYLRARPHLDPIVTNDRLPG